MGKREADLCEKRVDELEITRADGIAERDGLLHFVLLTVFLVEAAVLSVGEVCGRVSGPFRERYCPPIVSHSVKPQHGLRGLVSKLAVIVVARQNWERGGG
jgi:hypothetical protein